MDGATVGLLLHSHHVMESRQPLTFSYPSPAVFMGTTPATP